CPNVSGPRTGPTSIVIRGSSPCSWWSSIGSRCDRAWCSPIRDNSSKWIAPREMLLITDKIFPCPVIIAGGTPALYSYCASQRRAVDSPRCNRAGDPALRGTATKKCGTKMRLKGKVSIITGAGQGIGRATAIKFAKEGAKVAACDINVAAAEETAKLITDAAGEAIHFRIDVTDKETIAKMVEGVMAKWGRIDTLVNNAGIVQDAQFKKMTDDQFERVIDVNLKGVYNCTKAVVDIMLEQNSGCILNASSI